MVKAGGVAPGDLAALDEDDGAVEVMGLAGQRQETAARLLHIGRLVKGLVAKRQGLVGADDDLVRMALRNVHRLRLGEDLRDLVGRDAGILQRRLDGPLVEPARLAGEVDAGILQKLSAMNARGSEYDPLGHCVRPVRPGLP